jgi:putative component of toxin-antitoxin plasmid stabilization module
MTTPTTKFGAAQDGLFALLQARAAQSGNALNGIILDLGWPPTTPQDRSVFIDGTVDAWTVEDLTTHDAVSPMHRWERFIIPVICSRYHSSDDYQTTRNEALTYVAEVDYAVRTDRTLSGSVDDSEVVGGSVAEIKADDGRGLGVKITLHVQCGVALNG